MWKKSEAPKLESVPTPAPSVKNTPAARPQMVAPKSRICAGVTLKGDLSGEEDVLIDGTLEGSIHLVKNRVTVGESGRVKADISAKEIRVSGHVTGDLIGKEQVTLLETATVHGNIRAKSVTIETGAHFRGSVDMQNGPPKSSSKKDRGETVPIDRPNGAALSRVQ